MHFLSVIWLSHSQLSAVIEKTDNLTYPMLKLLRIGDFNPKVTVNLVTRLGT